MCMRYITILSLNNIQMMKHNNYYLCFLILHGLFPQNFGWIFKYYYSIPGIWNAFISLPVLEIWLLTKFSFQSIKTKYWLISKLFEGHKTIHIFLTCTLYILEQDIQKKITVIFLLIFVLLNRDEISMMVK